MKIHTVGIDKAEEVNVILGQAHFIKTVEDLHEAMVNAVPGVRFGLAFNEASGPALVRTSGTDDGLTAQAAANAAAIGAGHVFRPAARQRLSDQRTQCGQGRARGLPGLLRYGQSRCRCWWPRPSRAAACWA